MHLGPKVDIPSSIKFFHDFLNFPNKKNSQSIIFDEQISETKPNLKRISLFTPAKTSKTELNLDISSKSKFSKANNSSKFFDGIRHVTKKSIYKELGKITLVKRAIKKFKKNIALHMTNQLKKVHYQIIGDPINEYKTAEPDSYPSETSTKVFCQRNI